MPLMHGKSKGAFEHNIKAEMKSGKPQAQALAIAYSVKRKAQHKAMGGEISDADNQMPNLKEKIHSPKSIAHAIHMKKMAHGGEIDDMEMPAHEHDEFLSAEMEPEDAILEHHIDSQEMHEEAPHAKKHKLISGIMEKLRSKHYGK